MKNQRVIYEALFSVLDYDRETGLFTWLTTTKNCKKGDVAGAKNDQGYIVISVDDVKYRAHRLAWFYVYGVWPENIDHIDHIRANNKFNNLRNVTHQENHKNASLSKNNKSGFNGVSWCNRDELWIAGIRINGNRINLGGYKNKDRAIKRREFANILYGFHENHGRKSC